MERGQGDDVGGAGGARHVRHSGRRDRHARRPDDVHRRQPELATYARRHAYRAQYGARSGRDHARSGEQVVNVQPSCRSPVRARRARACAGRPALAGDRCSRPVALLRRARRPLRTPAPTSGSTTRASSTTPTRCPPRPSTRATSSSTSRACRSARPTGARRRRSSEGEGRATTSAQRQAATERELAERRDRALLSSRTRARSEIDLAKSARRRDDRRPGAVGAGVHRAADEAPAGARGARRPAYAPRPVPRLDRARDREHRHRARATSTSSSPRKKKESAAVTARYDADKQRWRELQARRARAARIAVIERAARFDRGRSGAPMALTRAESVRQVASLAARAASDGAAAAYLR